MNNGTRDGDPAAASRYTECRMSEFGEAMLEDIHKDTVEWQLTYTEEEKEPVYLTSTLPNLIINGTSGIAVATACSFAPHNLSEVMDAALFLIDNRDCNPIDLMDYIKGPDFPTGGTIVNESALQDYITTGKGKAIIRGEYTLEDDRTIVFTSIPYKVSKDNLTIEIDKLCENNTIQGISSIRDESNKDGVRYVIELEKNANPAIVIQQLFNNTSLETTFSINQVALVNKKPRLLNIKELLDIYIDHQQEVLIRKTNYDLERIKYRIHILEGLLVALGDIDNVIKLIRESASTATAKTALMEKYELDEDQTKAILDMKLSRLAKLEESEIVQEKSNLESQREKLDAVLANPSQELKSIFSKIKQKFGDNRRTNITQLAEVQETKAKRAKKTQIAEEKCVVILTESGLVKKILSGNIRAQRRNGKGVRSQDDLTASAIQTTTNSSLLAFTNTGKVYNIAVKDIVEGTNTSKGKFIDSLEPGEKPNFLLSAKDLSGYKYLLTVTKKGIFKKTELSEFAKLRRSTKAIKLKDGDAVAYVGLINDEDIIFCSKHGYGFRTKTTDLSATGKTSMGIKAMNLEDDDEIASVVVIRNNKDTIAIFGENGSCKRVPLDIFSVRSRGAKGNRLIPRSIDIAAAMQVSDNDSVLICGDRTNICIEIKEVPTVQSAVAVGVGVIKDSSILSVTKI